MKKSAVIEGAYRYALARRWADGPALGIVMLNPSTADAERDDPTILQCIKIAQTWGYDGIEVRNLFAYRSTKPEGLLLVKDPIGPKNNAYLANLPGPVLCAWGAHGRMMQRDRLAPLPGPQFVLGLSRDGIPLHPLALQYMGRAIPREPVPWRR